MRSLLFVPADSERKLARGLESGADALILDLEDSVAASNRPTARRLARDFLEAHGPDRIRRYVRVNPLASGLALDDLAATVPGRPDGILLPKCVPEDVRTLDNYLSAFEAASGAPVGAIRIIAIATETPQAVFALGGYAGVSPRLEAITWGAEDLAACLGGNNRTIDGDYDGPYKLARSLCLLAAAAADVVAIDTIYTDFRDEAGLKAECAGGAPLRRWTSYPLSRTGWLKPRHALASQDEGVELVSMREGSGLRLRWCAVVWVKENLPLQQHTGHPKQPVGDTA